MAKLLADVSEELYKVSHNPAAMSRLIINEVEKGGITLLTTNDPFVYAVQSNVMTAHTMMMKIDNTLPKVFSSMANSHEDIYRHMSDKDTANVFSRPGVSKFIWVFDYDQLKAKAPLIEGSTTKKITIPVNTEYMAKDTRFSQPYPIDIRFLDNDGVRVNWDTTYDNPFTTLTEPDLSYTINRTNFGGVSKRVIAITATVEQYNVRKFTASLIPGLVWRESYYLNDQFYTVRVSHYRGGKLVPLKRALSIETVDPLDPTVVIKVNERGVELTIPEVYTNSGLVEGEIIIELVESKGDIVESYENYTSADFNYHFTDHLNHTNSLYTNVLKIVDINLFSQEAVSGGRNALTLEELRERIIENTLGNVKVPVTDDAIEATLKDKGYSVTKAIDTLTELIYLAATGLPDADIDTLTGPIGTVSTSVILNKETLDSHRSICKNDYRYTITPDTLFKVWSSNVAIYPNLTLKELRGIKHLDKVTLLENNQLLSLPYHLVIDINNEFVEGRAYKLDEPKIVNRSIKYTNENIPFLVSTTAHSIKMTETGFKIMVESAFNKEYQDIPSERLDAYLSITTEAGLNFLEGKLVGVVEETGNYIWEWEIESNLDLDRKDNLIVNNLVNSGGGVFGQPIELDTTFNLTYAITGTAEQSQYSIVDDFLPPTYLGLGITLETIKVHLGDRLQKLWCMTRPLPGSLKYKRYEEDVPATYPKDVLLSDGNGGWVHDVVDGEIVFRKEFLKGDPILEEDGTPRIRHHKNTIVYENGKPVIDGENDIAIEADMWLVDTRYLVATTSEVMRYNKLWKQYVDTQTLVTLPEIADSALARTDIALTTKNSIGKIKVMLENEVETYISAAQKFAVIYYVEDVVRKDQEAISQIKLTTNRVIYEYLSKTDVISTNGVGKALMSALSYTVKDIVVEPLDNAQQSRYFKVLDSDGKVGVAKRLRLADNGELTLEDDINTTFLKYTK